MSVGERERRDRFAAAALQGLLASETLVWDDILAYGVGDSLPRAAWAIADAMMDAGEDEHL